VRLPAPAAVLLAAVFLGGSLTAQTESATATPEAPAVIIVPAPAPPPPSGLRTRDAIVLGLVEGITEFLPISSTGHLIIASHALQLGGEAPLRDATGQPLWAKPPSPGNPAGVPLTRQLAIDTYIVVIQAGAIAAVALLYWAKLLGMLRGLLGHDAAGLRLLRNLLLAFFPVVILGLLLGSWIDAHLFSIEAVIAALISGAVLMLGAESWRKRRMSRGASTRKEPSELTAGEALGIGLMQCLALWPGTSRSMVTMVGGYFCGLSPARAAEFSFLVGLPTLGGAALYKGYRTGPAMLEVFGWGPVLLGTGVAAVSAALAVRFLVQYLSRHGLSVFAIYRLLLAGILAWVFLA
jgi:undecaprenyl-diphosphatase